MASSLRMRRHRRGIADQAGDYDDRSSGTLPDDTDTGTDEEEEEEEEEDEDHRLHLGLQSMTAKGIQHLCSELLEIKKASEQELRANVYLGYLSFIRMFHEAGDLDKDVHRLKRQVIAHRRLIQHLSSNCGGLCSSSTPSPTHYSEEEEEADMDMDDEEEVELEVLLSEHRMEQALELVLQQQKPQRGRVVVAERLASVAGNPRTPRPELLEALSGLCKLGEAERANRLLFSWHRARLLVASSSEAAGEDIRDLARMVFSSIAGASRSLVALHGGHHPYTPQLLRWAREEMVEDHFIRVAFSGYVSRCWQHDKLALVLEAAECAASYSSSSLQLLQLDMASLMAPCILEALPMYARHLKEVVRLLVASDGEQVLGRFRAPALLQQQADDDCYCLLTASGRKFVTLLQEVVDDVACPLQRLGMDSAAAQLVADLFGEYLSSVLLLLIPNNMWQVSVLINCTTLVSLLPTIWSSGPAQARVGSLIKEAAGQVWGGFCQQFIRDTMDCRQVSELEGTPLLVPQGQGQQVPSVCLQVVFLRVRRLKEAYGAILLGGDDGTMRKLLQELMEAIISWLSTNPPESWKTTAQQAQVDVHFILEIARLGGFDVTASALGLLAEIIHGDGDRHSHCAWAADAANHAVQVLLRHNITAGSAADAAEEFESESNDIASSRSSDEFVSIEDEGEEEKPILGSDQAAPQHPENGDDGIHDDSRRPAAADNNKDAPRGRGRGRKKKQAAVSTSSRPRWQ